MGLTSIFLTSLYSVRPLSSEQIAFCANKALFLECQSLPEQSSLFTEHFLPVIISFLYHYIANESTKIYLLDIRSPSANLVHFRT